MIARSTAWSIETLHWAQNGVDCDGGTHCEFLKYPAEAQKAVRRRRSLVVSITFVGTPRTH